VPADEELEGDAVDGEVIVVVAAPVVVVALEVEPEVEVDLAAEEQVLVDDALHAAAELHVEADRALAAVDVVEEGDVVVPDPDREARTRAEQAVARSEERRVGKEGKSRRS